MCTISERSGIPRIREQLRTISDRAVEIRKLLSKSQQRNSTDGEYMDDAMQLAETIEKLGDLSQRCSAEDAFEILSRIEVLISVLEGEIDRFFAS